MSNGESAVVGRRAERKLALGYSKRNWKRKIFCLGGLVVVWLCVGVQFEAAK